PGREAFGVGPPTEVGRVPIHGRDAVFADQLDRVLGFGAGLHLGPELGRVVGHGELAVADAFFVHLLVLGLVAIGDDERVQEAVGEEVGGAHELAKGLPVSGLDAHRAFPGVDRAHQLVFVAALGPGRVALRDQLLVVGLGAAAAAGGRWILDFPG